MRVVHCRREPYTHHVARPSPLGNPFSHRSSKFEVVPVATRAEAIDMWERYARGDIEAVLRVKTIPYQHRTWLATPEEMMKLIRELPEDAVLACWCFPLPCHADRIVKIWKELHSALPKQSTT